MSGERKVQLQSSDNVTFEVDLSVVQESQFVMETIEATEDYTISLSTVPSNILAKVIEYCIYHARFMQRTDENPAPSEDEMQEWDATFVLVDHPTLVGLIRAAYYLNMEPFLSLICRRVVDLIRDKTVEDIRRTFGILNDHPPEQEEEKKKLDEWMN